MKGPAGRRTGMILTVVSLIWAAALWVGPFEARGEGFAFPEMSGWKIPEAPQKFSPRTLYQYINGAADLYLAYEFQELNVAEYRNEQKAAVTVEIYRHKNPTQAFGIYSQERLATARYLDVGAQGYQEPTVFNFITGPYYVKINGYKTGPEDEKIMSSFGRKIEAALGGKTLLPEILSAFPADGKKENTEKFIAKDFLGYSFLHNGFTTDYEVAGKKFKIFAIEGRDPDDCRGMVEKYLAQNKSQAQVAQGAFRLKDPYHGEVDLFWKGRFIWGILELSDPALRSKVLKEIEARTQG